jgi:hypothetical protein
MELTFEQVGPPREASIELPPAREFLADYVLVFDEARRKTVYLAAPNFHRFGHGWTFDGSAFTQLCDEDVHTEGPRLRWQGVWDVGREAVVAWNFAHDSDYQDRVYAVVCEGDAVTLLEPGGEQPAMLEDSDDVGGCFAYDRARKVTVCMTGRGVWELGADERWTKVRDDTDLPTDENWREACFGGAWDPRSQRTLFYWVCEDADGDDQLFLWAWDGETLERLSTDGLPEELVTGWMNTGPVLVTHPDGAIVLSGWDHPPLVVGAEGVEPWEGWEEPCDPPRPASAKAAITWDASLEAFVTGPGEYEPAKGEFPQDQHVFYVGDRGGFRKLGATEAKSALADLWAKRFGAFVGGRWQTMGNFYLTLLEWDDDDGWRLRFDGKEHRDLWDGGGSEKRTHALVGLVEGPNGTPWCVANDGQVFAFEGATWVARGEADEKLWKHRMWASLAFDPSEKRLVAWGGEVNGRRSNHVLLFDIEEGRWRKAKKSSPKPRGHGRPKEAGSVAYQLYWDHGLEALVRMGWEEAAVLVGERFEPALPPRMGELSSRHWRAVAADSATGQALVLDFESGAVFRFDLAGCEPVATVALPVDDLRLGHTNEDLAYRVICDDWAFDPATRRLHVQNADDRWGHYTVDLGPAFEAAAKLGPRTTRSDVADARSAGLYLVDGDSAQAFFATTLGSRLTVEEGEVGSETESNVSTHESAGAAAAEWQAKVAAAEERGFVPAGELSEAQLKTLACAPVRPLSIGELDADAESRLGGRPSDGSLEQWPTTEREVYQQLSWSLPAELNFFEVPEEQREELLAELREGEADTEPLGFLLQVATGDLLAEHSGVAVYVDTSGVATESPLHCRARLVPKTAWGQAPKAKAEGPLLSPRAIEVGEPVHELDESRAITLTQRDPELAEALEALELADPSGFSKLGGAPTWVQGPQIFLGKGRVRYRFLFQLDFDAITHVREDWPGAGLFGVLYVFVNAEETAAVAFWQHT